MICQLYPFIGRVNGHPDLPKWVLIVVGDCDLKKVRFVSINSVCYVTVMYYID